MPIYMDVHNVPGVKSKDVAEAHRKDLLHQDEYACKCMTYWIDEERESIFCLIEAPDKKAVEEMHNKAHGLAPNKVIEVNSNIVTSFLGRIYDPENAQVTDDGLKVFHDPSYRVLVIISHEDPVLLRNRLGMEKADTLLHTQLDVTRKYLQKHGGREAEHDGIGFILSFSSANKALEYTLEIYQELIRPGLSESGLRIALNSGEPLEKSNHLFGDTIQFANNLCFISRDQQIAISGSVRDLVSKDHQLKGSPYLCFPPQDENLLQQLFTSLENHWQDADFDIDVFAKDMAMSKSRLYRKIISLTGMSPNILIKDYRLMKAKELMKKQQHNIAQVTFDSGFTSPSYFTKCFKQRFGLLPMAYVELLS